MPSTDPDWREAFAKIGELVLLTSGLDFQLNHVVIEILNLDRSPMLEPVVATLDASRKLEILKGRIKHLAQKDWRSGVERYLDKVERVSKARNTVCHSPLLKSAKGFEFRSPAAAKLLKSLDLRLPANFKHTDFKIVDEAIAVGERALAEGENILRNFRKINVALAKRRSAESSAK